MDNCIWLHKSPTEKLSSKTNACQIFPPACVAKCEKLQICFVTKAYSISSSKHSHTPRRGELR